MNAIERDYALSALRTQGGQRKAGTSASFWGMAAALAGGGSVQPALGMDLTAQGTGPIGGPGTTTLITCCIRRGSRRRRPWRTGSPRDPTPSTAP